MNRITFPLLILPLLMLTACKGDKKSPGTQQDEQAPPVKVIALDEIPGIFEARGTIGDGTSMNVLEFINEDNDTIYITVNGQAIMGGVNVGDEVEIIYNVAEDDNIASVAVNLTTLQHLWSQNGTEGKTQSLELNSNGRASTYNMSVDYNAWEVRDGLLLLYSPQKPGDEKSAPVDSFEIMQLTTDSLVLMHGNIMTEFARYN